MSTEVGAYVLAISAFAPSRQMEKSCHKLPQKRILTKHLVLVAERCGLNALILSTDTWNALSLKRFHNLFWEIAEVVGMPVNISKVLRY